MGALYLGYAYMIFNWIVKLVAIYGMFLAIKAFKIYIKKNS